MVTAFGCGPVIEAFTVVADLPEFIVVSKAEGVNFHCEESAPGLVALVQQSISCDLWPVHRLDKMTSGLLLLAKSAEMAAVFGALFEQRLIEKYYLAIGEGKPKKKQGLIVGDMTRSRRKSWKLSLSRSNPAVTQFMSQGLGGGLRLFLLKPHTGKTHQLRVALKSIGSPIVGDEIYSARHERMYDRGYLHAFFLGFTINSQRYEYSLLPDSGELFSQTEFQAAMALYLQPNRLAWPRLR